MIGVVIVAHGGIGCEMVEATCQIIPGVNHMRGVSVRSGESPEAVRSRIAEAIKSVDQGHGVIILTDMFGGTPSNVCLSFLEPLKTEVVSGFNLPMLIKLANLKEDASFKDTVTFIQQYGQKNIVIASTVLAGRTKK